MRRFRIQVAEAEDGMRLDAFLEGRTRTTPELTDDSGAPLSKSKIRKLILSSAVRANGRARPPGFLLRAGSTVEGAIDPKLLHTDAPSRADREWRMSAEAIVFEDEFLIVVNKPYGLPTQPTLDPSRPNLYGELQRFLVARDGPEAYVGLHHRLDRDTSGLVLFTKKKEANKGVSELFRNHEIRKTYVVIGVWTPKAKLPPPEFTVRNYLKKDSLKKGRMRSVHSGGDLAITDFRVLDRTKAYCLFQAEPRTGRMHQIRVHLAEMGWPILGDETYGRRLEGVRLALHAAVLTFQHPISSLSLEVRAPIPPDFHPCLKKAGLSLPSGMTGKPVDQKGS